MFLSVFGLSIKCHYLGLLTSLVVSIILFVLVCSLPMANAISCGISNMKAISPLPNKLEPPIPLRALNIGPKGFTTV